MACVNRQMFRAYSGNNTELVSPERGDVGWAGVGDGMIADEVGLISEQRL